MGAPAAAAPPVPRAPPRAKEWRLEQERCFQVRVLALCHASTSASLMRTAFLTLARNASPLNTPKNLPFRQLRNWPETRTAPNSEESTFRSRMREAIWSTRSRYRMGCPPAVSSMECASTRLEVGVPLFPDAGPQLRRAGAQRFQTERMTANRARCRSSGAGCLLGSASLAYSSEESLHRASSTLRAQPMVCLRQH